MWNLVTDTYSTPEHRVHTNEPIVMLTYVGPFWPQSKHWRFPPEPPLVTSSRRVFRFLSSCFLRTTAMLLLGFSVLCCCAFTVLIAFYTLTATLLLGSRKHLNFHRPASWKIKARPEVKRQRQAHRNKPPNDSLLFPVSNCNSSHSQGQPTHRTFQRRQF